MSLTLVLLLIAFGLILLLIEILVIPGTSVAGIVGGALIIFSIWQSYHTFGTIWGHVILGGTIIVSGAIFIIAFKSNTWKKLMLNTNLEGRVNEVEKNKLHVGDCGKSISRISPAGTALFDNELYEVHTNGDFIDQETEIAITKLEDNKIFVKKK